MQLKAMLGCMPATFTLLSQLFCAVEKKLGWIRRGSTYCQLICDANKAKPLEFAHRYLHEAETGINDVTFSDEATIQLESNRFTCRKSGQRPKNKPRYNWRAGASQPIRLNGRIFYIYLGQLCVHSNTHASVTTCTCVYVRVLIIIIIGTHTMWCKKKRERTVKEGK